MLVGPWAGEEEPAQSVLKEDDLRGKWECQWFAETEPSPRWCLQGGAGHTRPLQENPLWKPLALPREGAATEEPRWDRTVAEVHHNFGCETKPTRAAPQNQLFFHLLRDTAATKKDKDHDRRS